MRIEVDLVIKSYLEQFGIQHATISRIAHESAMVAAVYKIDQAGSDPLILKICQLPRHYHRELAALKQLAHVIPVPHVKDVIPPHENLSGAILMEYLSGMLLQDCEITESLAYELGIMLARVHNIRGEESEETPLQYFSRKFKENMTECAQHLSPTMIRKCRDYFDAHVDLLCTADGPCMVHGDFHRGNIIVDGGAVQGIIDWSSMHYGFAEEDLSLTEYAGWNMSVEVKNAFLMGYGSIRPVPDYRIVLSLFQLSKRLDIIAFIIRTGTWKTDHANLYHDLCKRIENSLRDF